MQIKRYNNDEATALALAHDIFVLGTQTAPLHVAISGGSTPRRLFELMAQPPLRDEIRWEQLHLYWVDERCVPPTDVQSNYGMTAEALLKHVPLPVEQIHRIQGEVNPEDETTRYTALVRRTLPSKGKIPCLDVVILGIGDDGHTSSIFPHQMKLLETPTPYVVATHPSGQKRIAMTGPTILAARRVVMHAVGESKGQVLRQIVERSLEAQAYPAAYFVAHRPDLELYTDQDLTNSQYDHD